MIDMTPVVEAIGALAMVLVTCVLIPYIKARTTATQQAEAARWVSIAVSAAEQIYKGTGLGREKKKYVMNWLKCRGIVVDVDRLDAMIESAVHDMKAGAGNA
jgi:hypothetical protein